MLIQSVLILYSERLEIAFLGHQYYELVFWSDILVAVAVNFIIREILIN